jgi:4-alpha-glucanotransferase
MNQVAALDVRASGILLHPTSLPGRYGIGDLGPEAYRFVDALARAGQRWWQMLPVGPVGPANSPYLALSAFAGEPLLLSLDLLARDGLLRRSELSPGIRTKGNRVDYRAVRRLKEPLLRTAFERFRSSRPRRPAELESFRRRNRTWLEDYGLFRALGKAQRGEAWFRWPAEARRRHRRALEAARQDRAEEIEYQVFLQYEFDRQWRQLRERCREAGVRLIGDAPIFVAHESADVWAHREIFQLDAAGRPLSVAGVPPDYFSATGQLWGNPIYRWAVLRRRGYDWWIDRLRFILDRFDAVRLDHFIGFVRHWVVSARARTAIRGRWVRGPGRAFFEQALETLGEVPIIAEDLGTVTPEVTALREEFGFPGMRVMQFGFDDDSGTSEHLPHHHPKRCVAYPGTHDNDTVVGWYSDLRRRARRRTARTARNQLAYVHRYLDTDGRDVHWAIIRQLLSSPADLAIIPLQDLMGLGSEARMNLPGTGRGNWEWRFPEGTLTNRICDRLRLLTKTYGRLPAKAKTG